MCLCVSVYLSVCLFVCVSVSDAREFKRFNAALTLGVAFSANIGGTATLIGCGPNITLAGLTERFHLLIPNSQRWGHGMPPTAVTFVERFHINHVPSSTRALICLVTVTFDRLTLKLVRITARDDGWATFLSISVFLWLFVLDLWALTCQTHHVTSRPWPLTLELTAPVGDTGLRTPSVFQV